MSDWITQDAVLDALRDHIGQDNGISARSLVLKLTGVYARPADERALRHVIEVLRRDGHHLCGHPTTGYFVARTDDELLRTVRFLHDRALTSLTQAAAMQRVSLPDLRGQLRLPT